MPSLYQQSKELSESYELIHLDSLKRHDPDLAQYFKRIIKDPNWFKGVRFESSGEIIHNLLIEELQKIINTAGVDPKLAELCKGAIAIAAQNNGSEDLIEQVSEKLFDKGAGEEVEETLLRVIKETPKLADVLNEYAKMNDIFRRLRSIEYSQRDEIEHKGVIADDFGYTLMVLFEQGCSQEQIQAIIDRVNFTPSLTSHPTNPQSVEYVGVAMNLIKVIANPRSTAAEVAQAVDRLTARDLRAAPDENKTQELEIDEVLHYLDAIWDSVDEQYELLQKAIKESRFPDLKLPDSLNQICVWVAGDGDGNKNATPESLQMNVDKFRARIKELYIAKLNDLGLIEIADQLKGGEFNSPQDLIESIKALKGPECENDPEIRPLLRKIRTFGFHFAKIDIRHTAVDLVKVKNVVDQAFTAYQNSLRAKMPHASDQEIRQEILKNILNGRIDLSQIASPGDIEMTKRIAGRFVVASQNPDMFEKIIAAEFDDPDQIKAVLQLLKDTGNKIAVPGATLSIVPLAESRDNLQKLHKDIETALNDDNYFDHLKKTKKVYFMIARSDTVRRDGVGAQDSQEHAITDSVKTIARILIEKVKSGKITQEELKQFQIIPYSGGGNALQRGGGKMTELSSVYGRYCLNGLNELEEELTGLHDDYGLELLEALRHCIKEPCLTTQGHQNALLYQEGGKKMSRFISQAVYAGARTTQLIKNKGIDIRYLEVIYRHQMQEYLGLNDNQINTIDPQDLVAMLESAKDKKGQDGKKLADELITAAKFYYQRRSAEDIASETDRSERRRMQSQNEKIEKNFHSLLAKKSKLAKVNLTAISANAVAEYKKHIGSEDRALAGISSPVDKLLNVIGPWYFTKMGNVSSRGNVRGKDEVQKDKTFGELKGKDPKVLAQRAIGVESVSTHSGTGAVAFLGWRNAVFQFLEIDIKADVSQMNQDGANKLQELFCCSKSFRDLMRSAEMTIAQTDYEEAWSALYEEPLGKDDNGTLKFRPRPDYIKKLNDQYVEKIESNPDSITPEETLAYLDYQASQTKQLIQIIAGNRSTCPEFANQEVIFKNKCQVATNIKAATTRFGNGHLDCVITKDLRDVMKATYVATDCDAKPGLLMEPHRAGKDHLRGNSPRSDSRFASRPVSVAPEDETPQLEIVSRVVALSKQLAPTVLAPSLASSPPKRSSIQVGEALKLGGRQTSVAQINQL